MLRFFTKILPVGYRYRISVNVSVFLENRTMDDDLWERNLFNMSNYFSDIFLLCSGLWCPATTACLAVRYITDSSAKKKWPSNSRLKSETLC
jgi:hypothetical protein